MVTIKFFAAIKERIGKEGVELKVSKPLSVRELVSRITSENPKLSSLLEDTSPLIAVNQEFVDKDALVRDGDEVAFIPPVSGGINEKYEGVRIQKKDFSVDEEIKKIKGSSKKIGGIAIFLGTTRNFSRGRNIQWLGFEHYPGMAEKKLAEIRKDALDKFDILEVTILHRTGQIDIGENIVLIVVGAEHRKDAFEACRWCIDQLKQITPIWKKERTSEGDIWVEEHP